MINDPHNDPCDSPVCSGLRVAAGDQILVPSVVEVIDGLRLGHHQGIGPVINVLSKLLLFFLNEYL